MMAVGPAGREPGAHAGSDDLRAGIGDERDLAFEHVNELVLPLVPVALGGVRAGREVHQVDAEVPQSECVAERPLAAAGKRRT